MFEDVSWAVSPVFTENLLDISFETVKFEPVFFFVEFLLFDCSPTTLILVIALFCKSVLLIGLVVIVFLDMFDNVLFEFFDNVLLLLVLLISESSITLSPTNY